MIDQSVLQINGSCFRQLPERRRLFVKAVAAIRSLIGRRRFSTAYVFGLVMVFCACGSIVAQETRSDSRNLPTTLSNVLETVRKSLTTSENPTPPSLGGPQDQLRDPTMPTDRILEQVPQPIETDSQSLQQKVVRTPQFVASLPELPTIKLRGMALSHPDKGKAILDVDGKSVSISLVPRNQQTRMPIPAVQFYDYQPALFQRASNLAAMRRDSNPIENEAMPEFEMCLDCSFTHNGLVFNLEAFTSDTLLFKALPHDEMIIVRSQLP